MSIELWNELWDRFYENRRERDRINAELVECKRTLRSAGVPALQPLPPKSVASE